MTSDTWLIVGSGTCIALKGNENVSLPTCSRATDGFGPSSPARSQAIKRLIRTDWEPLKKRRCQDSTYGSCDVSEVASTEINSTETVSTENASAAVEELSCSWASSLPITATDSFVFSSPWIDFDSPKYDRSQFLDVPPSFPEPIELPDRDHWSQLLDNHMKIPCNLEPNAYSVLGSHEIEPWTPLGIEQVPNVHPADFLALYKTRSLSLKLMDTYADMIQGSHNLTAAVKFLNTASYNPRTRTINLRGPVTLIKSAKEKLQTVMTEVSRHGGLQYLQRKQKEVQQKTNAKPFHGANQTCDVDLSANIFALSVQQDSITITTWIESLLPKLPTILDPAIGQDYTASLIRQGASEVMARPHIRIQSPRKLPFATRKNIKLSINDLCKSNMRACIPVSFSTGYLRLLANATCLQSVMQEKSLPSDNEEEEEEDDDPGFDSKRYCQNPGMGSSIGMRCTRIVSATLGGYILVDGRKLLLTVDHFIERSQKENYTVSPGSRDLFTLTSPSLSDVDEMCERLDLTMRDLLARSDLLSKKPGDNEISLNEPLSPKMLEIMHELDMIEKYQTECNRSEGEFILGELAGRCKPNGILSSDAESPSSSELAPSCRMDWAMFSINNPRMGENRHSFQPGSGIELAETTSEVIPNWTGDRDFCNDTCDLEPNASVHYVGQRSGPRKGQINAVPMLLKREGRTTHEWALICPERISSSEDCEGDSGAWVLRDFDKKLVGLLWGWNDGQLLFSPINQVFADIKNTFPARNVCLPQDQINRGPPVMALSGNAVSEPVLICGVKKQETAKPYKLSTLLRSKPKILRSISRAKPLIENEAVKNPGASSTFDAQKSVVSSTGRRSLPSPSCDQPSSDSSLKLDMTSPTEHWSPCRMVATGSVGELSMEKQPLPKYKKSAAIVNNFDAKCSTTVLKMNTITRKHSQLVRAGSEDPDFIPHKKCRNPLRYILLPVSTNNLAFDPLHPSQRQSMKLRYKSSTFPISQRDIAAQPKGFVFRSFNGHVHLEKPKDLSQSNLLSPAVIL